MNDSQLSGSRYSRVPNFLSRASGSRELHETREISRSKFPLPSIINNRKLRLVEIPDLFSSRECFSSPIFSLAVVDLSAPSWERTDGKVGRFGIGIGNDYWFEEARWIYCLRLGVTLFRRLLQRDESLKKGMEIGMDGKARISRAWIL